MRLYKQRRRPYTHIIPKHEILKTIDGVVKDGGAYCVVLSLNQIQDIGEEVFNANYTKLIEESFDAVSRAVMQEHGIDCDYINISKVFVNDEEAIVIYITADELGIEIVEEKEVKSSELKK